jgi:hypothetical protein
MITGLAIGRSCNDRQPMNTLVRLEPALNQKNELFPALGGLKLWKWQTPE